MKTLNSILFFILFIQFGQAQKISKKAIKALNDIAYIEAESFTFGKIHSHLFADKNILIAPEDSILQLPTVTKTVALATFFIGKKEVSNKAYRAFVEWVRDSVAHANLGHIYEEPGGDKIDWSPKLDWSEGGPLDFMFLQGDEQFGGSRALDIRKLTYSYKKDNILHQIRVYPDTLCWIRDVSFSYNEKMTRYYFFDKTYDDFPVVGITKEQAEAYCIWKQNQINQLLNKTGADFISISLPTEEEWEYAATTKQESAYAWVGNLFSNNKEKYLANFGTIEDQNGLAVVYGLQDGFWYTSPPASYPANSFGLYDMSGNVEEWVINPTKEKDITKGGSWMKGPIYMLCSASAAYKKNADHSHIGFRIKVAYDENSNTCQQLKKAFAP